MILELKNEKINVVQNSCELTDSALIYLKFKDRVIDSKDVVDLYIDGSKLKKLKQSVWRIDNAIHTGSENKIEVLVKRGNSFSKYTSMISIKTYISFGDCDRKRLPQIALDQNNKINNLEKEIEKINRKINVI